MSRRHLIFNSLVLCAALGASSVIGSGCSSSDAIDSSSAGAAGKSSAHAGRSNSSAGSDSSPAGTGNDVDSAGTGGDGGADTGAGATGGADPGRGGADGTGDSGAPPAAAGADSRAGSGNTAGSGTAGSGTAGSGNDAAIAHGLELTTANLCTTCHQTDYSGYAIYPNLTPDMDTGIGGWSDDKIKKAITAGIGEDGGKFCSSMIKFPFSDDDVADVIAYLRSLPAVDHAVTSVCPGHINP